MDLDRNQLERIRWVDSGTHLSDEWTKLEVVVRQAKHALVEVETVGFIVHEDDEVVVLGLSIDPVNDAVFGAQVIAKQAITRRASLLTNWPKPVEAAA